TFELLNCGQRLEMRLQQKHLLLAVAAGDVLKVHRTLDGDKAWRLHPLDGSEPWQVEPKDAEALLARGLIDSNMKFPAATLLITPKGIKAAKAAKSETR